MDMLELPSVNKIVCTIIGRSRAQASHPTAYVLICG